MSLNDRTIYLNVLKENDLLIRAGGGEGPLEILWRDLTYLFLTILAFISDFEGKKVSIIIFFFFCSGAVILICSWSPLNKQVTVVELLISRSASWWILLPFLLFPAFKLS